MSDPSRKQQLYAELMMRGFADLRMLLAAPTGPRLSRNTLVDALLDLLHNVPKTMLYSDLSLEDVFFLNHQARNFCRMSGGNTLLHYDWYMGAIQELFSLVPDQLRSDLKWDGVLCEKSIGSKIT